jgi:hypothetical protein
MGITIRTSSVVGKVETAQYGRNDFLDILSTKVERLPMQMIKVTAKEVSYLFFTLISTLSFD